MSKKLINLLRHGSPPREDDGSIEFWRIKDYLQNYFVYCHHWSDKKWKSSTAGGGGNKKRFQYCTDSSGAILYLRALQGHDGFFKYIYHVGCAINLHSIIKSGLTPGRQNLSNRQTVFLLPVDPMDKKHKDPGQDRLGSTASCTIHAQSMEETSKYCVLGRYQTCSKERIKVLSDAIERHHPLQCTPSLLYPEGYSDGSWRNHTRKSI